VVQSILDVKKTVLTWSAIITEPFADIDGNCFVNVLDVKKCVLIWSAILG